MFLKIKDFFRLIKFSHTVFALPFAFIGFFMAFTKFQTHWILILYVILCMVFARSAAMGFNRYLDRNIDAKNPRTKQREIPSGKVKPTEALWFVIVMSVLFVATTFLINRLVFYLSFVALFVVLSYSYAKRFTPLCHVILGIGLSLAPIGAYLAVSEKFDFLPIILSFIVLFWVSGFDIIYSLQDYEFDISQNLKSLAVLLGKKGALWLSFIFHIISAGLLVCFILIGNFGYFAWIGSGIFVIMLFYQHTIVKTNDLSKVNLAFGTTNGIASVLFAVFMILDILLKYYKS